MMSRGQVVIGVVLALVSYLGVGVQVHGHEEEGRPVAVPAFLWSNKDLFEGKNNLYIGLEGISQQELFDIIKVGFHIPDTWVTDDEHMLRVDLRNSNTKIVVFVADRLASADVSIVAKSYTATGTEADNGMSFLRSAVLHSKASAVLPYTKPSNSESSPWSPDANTKDESSVLYVTAENLNAPDFDFAQKVLSHKMVVISVGDEFSEDIDNHMRMVCAQMVEVVGDDYVAMFTALRSNTKTAFSRKGEKSVVAEYRILADESNSTAIRNHPNLLSSMLVSLLLVLMTAVYICCIDCVEGNSGFATRYPYKGKEFN